MRLRVEGRPWLWHTCKSRGSVALSRVESLARICLGVVVMGVGGSAWLLCALLVFPNHRGRARVSNYFAHRIGAVLLWLTGSRVDVRGQERLSGPAIFVSNHTSMLDILLAAWLVPPLTIALGKREILRYPIVGLVFLLSGSVAVDRSRARPDRSALHELARRLVERRLGVFMWPEGTRSADHTLGPFHVGFARLSQLTGLDVIPVVVHGAWHAWPRKSLQLQPTRVEVEVLERIPAARFMESNDLAAEAESIRAQMTARIQAAPKPRSRRESAAEPIGRAGFSTAKIPASTRTHLGA